MPKQEIVASAYIHDGDKILLAKRADTKRFMPGVYEAPGGHVEYGESVQSALARELQEELGVVIKVGEPFYVFNYFDDDSHVVEVCLLCELQAGQEIKLLPGEHSSLKWFKEHETAGLRPDGDPFTGTLTAAYARLKVKN